MEFNINTVINKFPVDSLFYAIVKNNGNEWIIYNKVFAYRIENDDIYLVIRDDNNLYTYNVNDCYKTREEAEKHLTPKPETVKVAVDVPTDYKTHAAYCCVIHGCKYGDDDCPVVNNMKILQKYLCEECDDSDMWDKIRKIFKET